MQREGVALDGRDGGVTQSLSLFTPLTSSLNPENHEWTRDTNQSRERMKEEKGKREKGA